MERWALVSGLREDLFWSSDWVFVFTSFRKPKHLNRTAELVL